MRTRSFAIAASMLVALSVAACDDDAEEDAAVTEESAPAETVQEVEPAEPAEPAETAEAPAAPAQDAAAPAQPAGDPAASPAMAAIAGEWAASEEMCTDEAITISETAVTLPEGECQVESSETDNGALTLQMACGAEGAQTWTIEGAQAEATPRELTVNRGEGEPMQLVRCE